MLTDAERESFARALWKAEVEHAPIEALTALHPEADIVDAYEIATLVTASKLAAGLTVKGHKIGLTSKAMRSMVDAKEPDYGTLFDDVFVPEASEVDFGRLNAPSAEVELAFVLGRGLSGPSVTVADVIRATDFVLPAIEIVDKRYTRRGPGNPVVDSIADAAWCGLVVLGGNPRRLTDIDIRAVGASLVINGELEDSGLSSAVMGNPVVAVAWLANKLYEFGVALEPGHVVLSGSFTRAVPFSRGDTVSAQFDTFGEVGFKAGR